MEGLVESLAWLGRVSLQPIWIPVLWWTLFALPAHWLLTRRLKARPVVQYRLHQALLLSLPIGLLLNEVFRLPLLLSSSLNGLGMQGKVSVELLSPGVIGSTETVHTAWNMYHAAGLLLLLAAAVALWQLLKVFIEAAKLYFLSRRLGEPDEKLQALAQSHATRMGIGRPVRVYVEGKDLSPMTFGCWRPKIVLPAPLTRDPKQLQMVLIHELVHVRQGDYLLRWIEAFVEAVFYVHPLVGRISANISCWREMACDDEVISRSTCSPKQYARLLYDTITLNTHGPAVLSMRVTNNIQQRIKAMNDYTRSTDGIHRARRQGLILGSLLIALTTLLIACTQSVSPERQITTVQRSPADSADQQDESVQMLIKANKTIHVNGQAVPVETLADRLNEAYSNSRRMLSIRVEDGTPMGFVNDIQRRIRSSSKMQRIHYRTVK